MEHPNVLEFPHVQSLGQIQQIKPRESAFCKKIHPYLTNKNKRTTSILADLTTSVPSSRSIYILCPAEKPTYQNNCYSVSIAFTFHSKNKLKHFIYMNLT